MHRSHSLLTEPSGRESGSHAADRRGQLSPAAEISDAMDWLLTSRYWPWRQGPTNEAPSDCARYTEINQVANDKIIDA